MPGWTAHTPTSGSCIGKPGKSVQCWKRKPVTKSKDKVTLALNGLVPKGQAWPDMESVRPWDSLSADEKKLFSRMAEVYAGFVSPADAQLGRVPDYPGDAGPPMAEGKWGTAKYWPGMRMSMPSVARKSPVGPPIRNIPMKPSA